MIPDANKRRTPYARSSGLLRYPARPRTCGLSASAGGKDLQCTVTPVDTTYGQQLYCRRYDCHPMALTSDNLL